MPRRNLYKAPEVNTDELPSEEDVKTLEMVTPMITSAINEMREISKKKPDGAINQTKTKILNRILEKIKSALGNDPSTGFLDILDEETLPSYSDAVLILGQYQAAIDQFKNKHYGYDGLNHRWFTKENPGKPF